MDYYNTWWDSSKGDRELNITVDWDRVVECKPWLEQDGLYNISFVFDDGEVCAYGYSNQKKFMEDYTKITYLNRNKEGDGNDVL